MRSVSIIPMYEVNGVSTRAKQKFAETMAAQADIHDLYERAVQTVDLEVEFLQGAFRALRGRGAESLRRTSAAPRRWRASGSVPPATDTRSASTTIPTCSTGGVATGWRAWPNRPGAACGC